MTVWLLLTAQSSCKLACSLGLCNTFVKTNAMVQLHASKSICYYVIGIIFFSHLLTVPLPSVLILTAVKESVWWGKTKFLNTTAKTRVNQAHAGMAFSQGSNFFKNDNIPTTEYLFWKYT